MASLDNKKSKKKKGKKSSKVESSLAERSTTTTATTTTEDRSGTAADMTPEMRLYAEQFLDQSIISEAISLPALMRGHSDSNQNGDTTGTSAEEADNNNHQNHHPRRRVNTDSESDSSEMRPSSPDSLMNNPYLNREKCLLCQCERSAMDIPSDNEDEELKIGPHNYALSQLSLWVCPKCKAALEEEERKGLSEPSFLDEEVEQDPNALKFLTDIQFGKEGSSESVENGTCCCEACKDRRMIETQQDEENSELQQCWIELRHAIRCIYRETGDGGTFDHTKLKSFVKRLCTRDPHQLFQRMESQAREYILEVKVRLLQQLTSGHKTPAQAKSFVSLMLEEYSNMCVAAKTLSDIYTRLEAEHLRQFSFTWELHDKHLFQSVIYGDPLVHSSLPMLITQLRLGAASNENSYPSLLHRYLKFDDEMAVVTVVWRDCQQRIDGYTDEQAAVQAKQRMLREDWEFFKAQRKILEQQVLKSKQSDTESPRTPTSFCTSNTMSSQCLESQFTDAMRNLLHGSDKTQPFTCPNCNRQRCPCDECSISHMITCGILPPEIQDSMLPDMHHNVGGPGNHHQPFPFPPQHSRYEVSVKPPSFSSTDSSSDADSDGAASDASGGDFSSSDSWDDKLKMNPNHNIFEELFGPPGSRYAQDQKDLSSIPINSSSDSSTEQCPCHVCQQENGQSSTTTTTSTTTPTSREQDNTDANTTIPPGNLPKPAALHLYPHIHGPAPTVNSGGLSAAHYKSLLQPQLYELHNSQPISASQATPEKLRKRTMKPSGMGMSPLACMKDSISKKHTACSAHRKKSHNHTNENKGDLDDIPMPFKGIGPYDGFMLPQSQAAYSRTRVHTHSSEMLPAAPPPFSINGLPMDDDHSSNTSNLPVSNTSTTVRTSNCSQPWSRNKEQVFPSCLYANPQAADSDKPHKHNDECFKNLRGPLNANQTTETYKNYRHEQYSKILNWKSTPTSTNLCNSSQNQFHPYPVTSCGSSQITQQASSTIKTSATPTPCQHTNAIRIKKNISRHDIDVTKPTEKHLEHHSHSTLLQSQHSGDTECSASLNNSDDDEDGSCSGQSSSASTSNQKDGKFCDCCYCEFFGHANPPRAPTSKNFPEMQERLRLRLKNKQKRNGCTKNPPIPGHFPTKALQPPSENAPTPVPPPLTIRNDTSKKEIELPVTKASGKKLNTQAEVDELVRFITGEATPSAQDSAKVDKKTRKKLKKAEQRARKLELAKHSQPKDEKPSEDKSSTTDESEEESEMQAMPTTIEQVKKSEPLPVEKPVPVKSRTDTPPRTPKSQRHATASASSTALNNSTNTARENNAERNHQPMQPQQQQHHTTYNNLNNTHSEPQNHSVHQQQNNPPRNHGDKANNRMLLKREEMEKRHQERNNIKNLSNNHLENHRQLKVKLDDAANGSGDRKSQQNVRQQPDGEEALSKRQHNSQQPKEPLNNRAQASPQIQRHKSKENYNEGVHKRKTNAKGDHIDEVFLPRDDEEVDDMFEKELNEFKRFCLGTPKPDTKIAVNVNVKDLLSKKKTTMTC